jgi:hypothetical protein
MPAAPVKPRKRALALDSRHVADFEMYKLQCVGVNADEEQSSPTHRLPTLVLTNARLTNALLDNALLDNALLDNALCPNADRRACLP